jgi:hypothetical protein
VWQVLLRTQFASVLNATGKYRETAATVSLRAAAKLEYVSSGPKLSAVGQGLQDQIGHGVSHFAISQADFERAVRLLERARIEESRKIKAGWNP